MVERRFGRGPARPVVRKRSSMESPMRMTSAGGGVVGGVVGAVVLVVGLFVAAWVDDARMRRISEERTDGQTTRY